MRLNTPSLACLTSILIPPQLDQVQVRYFRHDPQRVFRSDGADCDVPNYQHPTSELTISPATLDRASTSTVPSMELSLRAGRSSPTSRNCTTDPLPHRTSHSPQLLRRCQGHRNYPRQLHEDDLADATVRAISSPPFFSSFNPLPQAHSLFSGINTGSLDANQTMPYGFFENPNLRSLCGLSFFFISEAIQPF